MNRAFLKIVAGARQGLNITLSDDSGLTVGRRQGDLLIEDPMVSGRHFQLRKRGEVWWLQDLGSTNGTMVDGRLVREAPLQPGMEIAVGSTRMVLFVESDPVAEANRNPAQESSAQLEIAWLMDEELVELPGDKTEEDPRDDAIGQELRLPPGLNAVAEVIAGQDLGKVFRFTRGNVVIGRRHGEVGLTDAEVSRQHSVIEIFGREMMFLRDLGSTNGTFHNGRKTAIARLKSGDTIGVGKTVLRLQVNR